MKNIFNFGKRKCCAMDMGYDGEPEKR